MWNLSPSSFILVSRCVHLIRWEGNITPPLSLIPSQEFFLKKGMSLNFMLHWISEHLEYQNIWNIRTFEISEHYNTLKRSKCLTHIWMFLMSVQNSDLKEISIFRNFCEQCFCIDTRKWQGWHVKKVYFTDIIVWNHFWFCLILNLGIIGNWGNINHDYLEAWDARLLGWDYMMMMMV